MCARLPAWRTNSHRTTRRPEIPSGLGELDLRLNPRGFIDISSCVLTNLSGLWAAGDVTGKFQFTHYAADQAHHIGNHIMEDRCEPIPDTLVPWAMFTVPEVGHAGMTEEQARADAGDVRVAVLRASELDWFRTTSQTDGFAKVIADAGTGRLLGAHFICARGSTLAGEEDVRPTSLSRLLRPPSVRGISGSMIDPQAG